jgi:hypothetical protein
MAPHSSFPNSATLFTSVYSFFIQIGLIAFLWLVNDSRGGGGGGHLGKWRQLPACAFFELSWRFYVCVLNFIKIGL